MVRPQGNEERGTEGEGEKVSESEKHREREREMKETNGRGSPNR